MRFVVSFQGQRRLASLDFGRAKDVPALMRWRVASTEASDPHVRDAMEFRKLATKRWRYYVKGNEAASNPPTIEAYHSEGSIR